MRHRRPGGRGDEGSWREGDRIGGGVQACPPAGCGSTTTGRYRLWNAEEEEQLEQEVGLGERDATCSGLVVNAEESHGCCSLCHQEEVVV